jgi:hypothetical protein
MRVNFNDPLQLELVTAIVIARLTNRTAKPDTENFLGIAKPISPARRRWQCVKRRRLSSARVAFSLEAERV